MDLYEGIYFALIGALVSEAALPWGPNAFAPGSACAKAEERSCRVKYRLQKRLMVAEDPDIEEMPCKIPQRADVVIGPYGLQKHAPEG